MASYGLSELYRMLSSGDFISQDWVQERLRQMGVVFPSPLEVSQADLEEAVERFVTAHDLDFAVEQLVDSTTTVSEMARSLRDKNAACPVCPPNARLGDSIRVLLTGLRLVLPPALSDVPLGSHAVLRKLRETKEAVMRKMRYKQSSASDTRGYALDAWANVERVLRCTIEYYSQVLSLLEAVPDIDDFQTSLEASRKQNSLRPMLQAMRGIEKHFMPGHNLSEASNQSEQRAVRLRQECTRFFDRESPFAGLDIAEYDRREVIGALRNFYAHVTLAEIDRDIKENGSGRLFDALDAAIHLVEDFVIYNIAPDVIFVVARGWDELNRELVWVAPETEYKSNATAREIDQAMRFFLPKTKMGNLKPFTPYLVRPDISDGRYDPPLVQLPEDIQIRENLL